MQRAGLHEPGGLFCSCLGARALHKQAGDLGSMSLSSLMTWCSPFLCWASWEHWSGSWGRGRGWPPPCQQCKASRGSQVVLITCAGGAEAELKSRDFSKSGLEAAFISPCSAREGRDKSHLQGAKWQHNSFLLLGAIAAQLLLINGLSCTAWRSDGRQIPSSHGQQANLLLL